MLSLSVCSNEDENATLRSGKSENIKRLIYNDILMDIKDVQNKRNAT